MTVLVTGAAGFIGYHLSKRLLNRGTAVLGLDNFNNYYDPALKFARLKDLRITAENNGTPFALIKADLEDSAALESLFRGESTEVKNLDIAAPTKVVNLAAQAGVRYSIENPQAYMQSNIVGFCNILECCRHNNIGHLVYASSSSVYGGNTLLPFSEDQNIDHPVSIYAASKKSNELMAHTYSHLYGLPCTGLRFFTVYGPWGRPDMALFLFTKAMLEGKPIKVFNKGQMIRDFTYIDDIIESLIRVVDKPAEPDPNYDTSHPNPATSWAPYRTFNIGNSNPIPLMKYIEEIENALGIKSEKLFLGMQQGDVYATSAETKALENWVGFKPNTTIKHGVNQFVQWYRNFYGI